jgi:hypothetical protein
MTFQAFTNAEDAVKAIVEYMKTPAFRKLPQDMQDRIWGWMIPGNPETGTSQSFLATSFAELIYARKEEVEDNEALRLAAGAAAYGNLHSVDSMGGPRGAGIMQALRRRSGEKAPVGLSWPKAADDPDPRQDFLPKSEEPEQENNAAPDPKPNTN